MFRPAAGLLAAGLVALILVGPALAAPRVFSLDQCADQYVIALSPRDRIVGVSPRVGEADSYFRAEAEGLPRRRATAEAVLAAQPDVVVRYWGGDARLDQTLNRRHIRVVRIDEAADFDGVRSNLRRVAAALGQTGKGEALIAHLDRQLTNGAAAGRGQPTLYLTSGGFTAGRGTLIDSILRAAGFANAAPDPGYAPVPLERLALDPPRSLVLGFFDGRGASAASWGPGRRSLVTRIARVRAIDHLPAAILGCPAWFAGDGVASLAAHAAP